MREKCGSPLLVVWGRGQSVSNGGFAGGMGGGMKKVSEIGGSGECRVEP